MKAIGLMRMASLTALMLLIVPAIPLQAWAAPPPWALWAKTYGGTGDDFASSIQQTSDGGFAVAGTTNSSGAGGFDAWILRLNPGGEIVWQNAYGGAADDVAFSIQQTSDNEYVAAGCTNSTPVPFFPHCGGAGSDAGVLKLDAMGSVVWQKAYGGDGADFAFSVQQTPDDGFAVSGFTDRSAWIFKLDAVGNLNWQKTYEGFGCCILPMQRTSDGGFVVGGFSPVGEGVKILRLNDEGNVVWLKTYASIGFSAAFSVQQTFDDGFVVTGITNGFSEDGGIIVGDFWVLRLDSSGEVVWGKAYGGTGADYAESVRQTADGGFVVVGWTDSFGAGGRDAWVLKLDATGSVVWQRAYGEEEDEVALSVLQTFDGGFAVAGLTNSTGAGSNDFLVLKLDANGNIGRGRHCGLITTTSAIGADTAATVTATASTVTNTSIEGTTTAAMVTTTSAATSTICRSRR